MYLMLMLAGQPEVTEMLIVNNLLQGMKIAQNRYLRRKIELHGNQSEQKEIPSLRKEYADLLNGKDREVEEDFDPENIFSIERDYRREIIKKSSCMGKKLQRYFEFTDEQNFSYYREEKDGKVRKKLPTEEFKCEEQAKRDVSAKELKDWEKNKESKDKSRRLQIGIKNKKKYKYVYFYSSDPFEIAYLKLQIEYRLLRQLHSPIL